MPNSEEELEENSENEEDINENQENEISIQIPRRSTRINKGQRSLNLAEMASNAYISLIKDPEESKLDIQEPKSYIEAINSQEKELWLDSMKRELRTLQNNNTWTLIDLPKDQKAISTRWVYKIKQNDDKSINYKSRFVARGFEQLYGLNYEETFASVIKQMSFKTIFALAALNDWFIYKIDMNSAFTQGYLAENVYINQPEGFIDKDYPNKVLKLNKALYGLK